MRPGFPFAGAPGDLWAAAVANVFHVLVLVDRGRESGVDATLDRKPLVREIGDRGIGPHTRGVESRGAKPPQPEAYRSFPPKIIAPPLHNFRVGTRRPPCI